MTHVRALSGTVIAAIRPTKLHEKYVTLYAHKDRLIARKIPTRAYPKVIHLV